MVYLNHDNLLGEVIMDSKYKSALQKIIYMEEFLDDCSIQHKVPVELVRQIAMHLFVMQHLWEKQI